jgi:hypothetical protein
VPLDPGVYCGLEDLLKGDLDLPRYMGDGSQFVNMAAEDIDSHLGHIYVTPIEVADTPANRPTTLMLKRINRLLASGRILLDIATASESSDLHAYGRALVKEAMDLLEKIAAGEIVLAGAERIDDVVNPDGENFSGPAIKNEDSYSLVQSFYDRFNPLNGDTSVRINEAYGGTR